MLLALEPHPSCPPAVRVPTPARSPRDPAGIEPVYPLERAAWLWHSAPRALGEDFQRFRLSFTAPGGPLRFQFSADQFAFLLLDGHLIARGPDAGAPWHYSFATHEFTPEPGPHLLEAIVWWVGDLAPNARMTVAPGFALAGLDAAHALLTTGLAPWQVAALPGIKVDASLPQGRILYTGKNSLTDARLAAASLDWQLPRIAQSPLAGSRFGVRAQPRLLQPSQLPEMPVVSASPGRIRALWLAPDLAQPLPPEALTHPRLPEAASLLTEHGSFVVAPHSSCLLLWDFEDYCVGFPEFTLGGGRDAEVRTLWCESLHLTADAWCAEKGNRSELAGKFLHPGLGDTFITDGAPERTFTPYWWRAGRYLALLCRTQDQPLTLRRLRLHTSSQPLEPVGTCDTPAADFRAIARICANTLRAGATDHFHDSPYYEQLAYLGDTVLRHLIHFAHGNDDRILRRTLELTEASRAQWQGLAGSRFPSRTPQLIPSYSLLWVEMVHDFALWRGLTPAEATAWLPGVRHTLDRLRQWENADGLLDACPGWPNIDWVAQWPHGVPADGRTGVCALHNLIYRRIWRTAADLERWHGEPELAARADRLGHALDHAIRATFFDPAAGIVFDDTAHQHRSQHAQILGTLAGTLTPDEARHALTTALADPAFSPASHYFRHYLFEAFHVLGQAERLLPFLDDWQQMVRLGLHSVLESLEPSRSDCHAWSAHPLFHLPCSIAGIRPSAPGFKTVRIAPHPGPLPALTATLPHPAGLLRLSLDFTGGATRGTIELPPGLSGTFNHRGQTLPLQPGRNDIRLAAP